jgi:hypothetical protein
VTAEVDKHAAEQLELVQSSHMLKQRMKYEAIEQERQAARKRQKKEHA